MDFLTPSFLYISNAHTRSFHHRWHLNGQVFECDSCHSSCDVSACHSQHWTSANIHERLVVTPKQQRQLDTISGANINVFILCCAPRSVASNAQEFLLDAGINVVPQLLRLLFTQALQLSLSVTFHVNVQRHEMIFTSSELRILHHYDIAESVDVVFSMLLSQIQRYVSMRDLAYGTECAVRRIRLHIRRIGKACKGNLALPLQYRVKQACAELPHLQHSDVLEMWQQLPLANNDDGCKTTSNASSQLRRSDESFGFHEDLSKIADAEALKSNSEIRLLRSSDEYTKMLFKNLTAEAVASAANVGIESVTAAYLKHLQSNCVTPLALNANLYALKVCRNSRELFAAPHYLVGGGMEEFVQTPSYVILADVAGNFRQLVPITDVQRFLRRDRVDRVLRCHKCASVFKQQTCLALHRMLRCGRDFEVETMPPNCVEIYERTLPLDMVSATGSDKWRMYGIIE